MDPYRAAGLRCPTCPEVPLREFHTRLVCDECQGLMIEEADFASACADLANRDITLAFAKEAPTKIPCPKCERTLQSCRVVLTELEINAAVHRCSTDGLWFGRGMLAGVFALVGRRTGGITGKPYYALPRPTGLDGADKGPGGPASSVLRISQWRARPRRRTPTVTPINVYRDQRMPCPACKTTDLRFACDRWTCETCAGTFVQNAALESMVADMSSELWSIPAATGSPGERACPVCAEAMLLENVEQVPIDRCAMHGLWFDDRELTIALERASREFDAHGVRAWLTKLFS